MQHQGESNLVAYVFQLLKPHLIHLNKKAGEMSGWISACTLEPNWLMSRHHLDNQLGLE